ncbi:MAG: lipopolysaccharide biosynthesis protein, partial [Burkholderiales bacterium]|nr:lipopolysaccharide biosynthesis protein [Burkholderiales bacterium]
VRPVAASLAMMAALYALRTTSYGHPEALGSQLALLGALVAVGAIVYTLALLLLWNLSGREEGAEARLLRLLGSSLRNWSVRRHT